MQFPAGRLSDRIDRRYVLAGMAAIAAFDGLLLFLLQPSGPYFLIGMVIIYGAVANTLYPITVAHANDFAAPEDYVKVSGGLLLLYAVSARSLVRRSAVRSCRPSGPTRCSSSLRSPMY